MAPLNRLFWITIYLGVVFTASAQSNIDIVHYTKDYGLHYRWVYDITQDEEGFIWLANYTGLRRYDGQNFITWQHRDNDSSSLSTNTIIRLAHDNGTIWAYSEDGVFNKLHLATGVITRVHYRFDEESLDAEMKHFGVLTNGDFIALYRVNGLNTLWKYDTAENTFNKFLDIPSGEVVTEYFTERSDGKLWLWGMGRGYYLVDIPGNEVEYYPVETADPGSSVPVDAQRKFWYPASDVTSGRPANPLLNFSIPEAVDVQKMERITLDNRGNIWFYHDESEVYRYDVHSKTLERFVDPVFKKSRAVQIMYHFFEDRDGGYWNGHFLGAIRFKRRQNLFDTYFRQERGKSFNAREIVAMSPETLLVRDIDNDLYTLDLASREIRIVEGEYRTKSGENRPIYSMVWSTDGHLWTNQADKLIKTNIETGREEIFDVPLSPRAKDAEEDAFYRYWPRIFEDKSGNLWWCDPDGLRIFDRSTYQLNPVQVNPAPAAVNADFKFAQYDPSKDAIYGSYEKGIYVIDCRTQEVSLIELFSVREGYDLLITAVLNWNDEFWLSTNKGLLRYHPVTKELKKYTRKDGLPSSLVYSALGTDNQLWLATQHGLCQFDPYKNQIINYDEKSGLPFNGFNVGSFYKTPEGELFFGGDNGLIGFDPDDFKLQNGKKGPLSFVGITKYNQRKDALDSVNNLPYTLADELIVDAGERTLTFKYVHKLYGNEFSSSYAHIMEGLDNTWINSGAQNETRYTEIPPGNYTFRVKATGPNHLSALNELALPIEVKQYWYLRWWAVLIYVLLAMTGIYFVYKMLLKRNLAKKDAIRMKELDEVKTKMYTNITHEFRTPLTVILGMNDAVKDYTQDGEIDKVFHANKMIDRNGKNLLNLINQMLELSKLEAGILNVNNRKGNIIDYLKYRMESFQSYGEAKGVQIHFHPEEEIIMDFDVDIISYIVGNLVSNAIKFTPKNGDVYVQVQKTLNAAGDPSLELKVRDTGIGIDADKIDRIFDRFYQVDDSNVRKGEGTGIGLSLVKQLVKLLKGTIEVKSKLNEGAEFTVYLPITTIAETAKVTPSLNGGDEWSESIFHLTEDDTAQLSGDQNNPLVLIVEDNTDVAHYIGASIQENYRTVKAGNGIEGIEKAMELIPDIVISDIMMPEKDGFELCETLKKDERTSHIPIILLTGKADSDSKIQGLEHGADVYLSKPFNRKELLIRLRNLMALRAEIQKHYSESDFTQPISGLSSVENAFLMKIRTIVLEHIEDENFNISMLCDLVHLSRPQLHRKLIAITGESTSQLIRKIQMEKAKELLSSGEFNVSEVAYRVGFKTQAHFSRVFSEACGVPPSTYQKK